MVSRYQVRTRGLSDEYRDSTIPSSLFRCLKSKVNGLQIDGSTKHSLFLDGSHRELYALRPLPMSFRNLDIS